MNKEIYLTYIQPRPDDKGYQRRLKAIWDDNYSEYKHLMAKNLAEQIRNIKKKNLLSEVDRQLIELQQHITPLENEKRNDGENEKESENHQRGNEDETVEEKTDNKDLKQELINLWRKNFEKYIKLDIGEREFSTKTNPPPLQDQVDILIF